MAAGHLCHIAVFSGHFSRGGLAGEAQSVEFEAIRCVVRSMPEGRAAVPIEASRGMSEWILGVAL